MNLPEQRCICQSIVLYHEFDELNDTTAVSTGAVLWQTCCVIEYNVLTLTCKRSNDLSHGSLPNLHP